MDPIILTVIAVLLSALLLKKLTSRKLNLPPGPAPWPYVGNLMTIGNPPWLGLAKLAKQYGDIMSVKFGFMPVVILSSPEAHDLFYNEHGASIVHRPKFLIFTLVSNYGKTGIVGSNGDVWRKNRKLSLQMLLNKSKLPGYQSLVTAESQKMLLREIPKQFETSKGNLVDNWGEIFFKLIGSIMLRLCVGDSSLPAENPFSEEWHDIIKRMFTLLDKPYLGDVFAGFGLLPSQLYDDHVSAMNDTRKGIAHFIEVGTKEREKRKGKGESASLLDQFLDMPAESRLSSDEILGNMMELIVAASETTINTMHWAIIALANHPECQNKLREEVTRVLGDTTYSDDRLPDLPYLAAVVNETMRWSNLVNMTIARMTTEDIKIRGYDIPKGTSVIVNFYSMQTDDNLWTNAKEFNPERFIERPVASAECRDPHFAPFGLGPRHCLGSRFATMMMNTIICLLVQNYKITRPGPELLDTQPTPKSTSTPTVPARVILESLGEKRI